MAVPHIILVGGGHSHVQVVKGLAVAGRQLTVTLVSEEPHAYYSGMLPGCVAGVYSEEEVSLDLAALCAWAGTRFLCGRVTHCQPHTNTTPTNDSEPTPPVTILLEDGRSLSGDYVSFDVGSTVRGSETPGFHYAIPTRPLRRLLERLRGAQLSGDIVIVGGGVAGVELAFALHTRFAPHVNITILDSSTNFLSERGFWTQYNVSGRMKELDIHLVSGVRCREILPNEVLLDNGTTLPYDALFWATGAAPHPFLKDLNLDLSDSGYILVRDTLQTLAYPNIFAVGDCNCLASYPTTPKAGVYAVRQGPPLLANLLALVDGTPLQTYTPQTGFLALIFSGEQQAISSWKGMSFYGYLMWLLKDKLDNDFMNLFRASQLGPSPLSRN